MQLVSAILPTRGRQKWAEQALQSFLVQTYEPKQIVILDDLEDPSFDDAVRIITTVKYERSASRNISTKRNQCCAMADGEVICHWDSDDWSASTRMAEQAKRLDLSYKQVTGYHSLLFYVEPSGPCYKYVNDNSFALGTSLCYLKSFQQAHPFRHDPNAAPNVGEDTMFVREARGHGELISVDAGQLMVARIHSDNTSEKILDAAQTSYVPVSVDALPRGFFQ